KGYDKNWSPVTNKTTASFGNISGGYYTFMLKAQSPDGVWSKLVSYSFEVLPPWYLSWPAYLFYSLLFIAGIIGVDRFQRRRLILKERQRLIKRELEQARKIEKANALLEIQKEVVEEKNTELNAQNEEINAQNEKLTVQRDQLSEQNNSINESILYAKRIQTAVLPRQVYIDEILPENFILFKPRDEVSGDFYWVKQISGFIVIAAADCTGHGVPGAILSMLGMSFLSEIAQKRKITEANKVLNELRKKIKQALRQTGKKGEADDGMDIALCVLDTKTNMLQYSGANNPLYLIQNGEFKEIKADRMPIGYYPNEKPTFTNHEIQLKDGDVFFLFSDGYMDQFGGEKGFKYKSSNFQQFLFEHHSRPMILQKELLEQELKNWMKGHEQTDDILVMGVRV
ncbi:MAG: hypothetical protein DRJ07_04245, partial [Bacteroidetes bacterium]